MGIGQNSAKYRPTGSTPARPFHQRDELHQKDLRKSPENVHIQGPVLEAVSRGGHVSRLKSNRQVLRVPRVTLAPTCRHSSQTAV